MTEERSIGRYFAPLALFLAATATPSFVPNGMGVKGFWIYSYEPFLMCAVVWAASRVALTFRTRISLAVLSVWLVSGTWLGMAFEYSAAKVIGDVRYPVEMLMATLVVIAVTQHPQLLRLCSRTLLWSLWISAALTLSASFGLVALSGRAEEIQLASGGGDAQRLLTNATFFALATLCFWIGAAIIRLPRRRSIAWWAPSVLIVFLAFSRNHVLAIGAATILGLCACLPASAAMKQIPAILAVVLTVGGAVLLLPPLITDLSGNGWYATQIDGFTDRVINGLDSAARARDPSAMYREKEISYLSKAFDQSPFVGEGFGYAYQPPVPNKTGSFWLDRARYYSHNFYWWTAAKTGILGLFAVLVGLLWPAVSALRNLDPLTRCAGVACGAMLAVSYYAPLPIDNPATLVVGSLVGLSLAGTVRPDDIPARDRAATLSPMPQQRPSSGRNTAAPVPAAHTITDAGLSAERIRDALRQARLAHAMAHRGP